MSRADDAWMELHVGLPDHPKTLRLRALLGLTKAAAVGHLALLWAWALKYAGDGSLRRFSDAEVANAASYDPNDGTPEAFVHALTRAGFIDGRTRRLHDWGLYSGRLIDRRARDAARMREHRSRTSQERSRDVQGNLTRPNLTEPTPPTPPSQEANDLAGKYLDRLRKASPAVFDSFTVEEAFETAADFHIGPDQAARLLGDVYEWWRTAKRRWTSSAARGWRNWCKSEAEKRAERAQANGQVPMPTEPSCPECNVPVSVGHAADCPVVEVST